MGKTLGIIAGKGQFPLLVAQGAKARGYTVVIAGFSGHTDPEIFGAADHFVMLHLGQVGKLIDFMHRHTVKDVCFAGAISKPKAMHLRPDVRAMKMLFSLRGKGDDALLRRVAEEFSSEGISVVSPAGFTPLTAGTGRPFDEKSPFFGRVA